MEGYQGTTVEPCDLNKEQAALYFSGYGQYDGDHHIRWALDQVVRIMNDAPVTLEVARWENGHSEKRYSVGTSDKYEAWVKDYCDGEDGPDTYSYDAGSPP